MKRNIKVAMALKRIFIILCSVSLLTACSSVNQDTSKTASNQHNEAKKKTKTINQDHKKLIEDYEDRLNKVINPYAEKWTITAYQIRNLFESNGHDDPNIKKASEELNKQNLDVLIDLSKINVPNGLPKDVTDDLNSSQALLKTALFKSDKYMNDYRGFWDLNTDLGVLNSELQDAIDAQKNFKDTINEINNQYNIEPIKYFTFSKDDMHLKKEPAIGMTEDEVKNSTWGEPEHVNTTTTANGTSEQWVYSGYRYIYFEDGVVTAIQGQK